ncbi:phosphinothricin acetyltransferase [Natranaerovirga pectinivora]|uniref:Phosphinothricin acetyltransferase n=1 Tax=Natranaerovirga pectinivora TaxID=682400 RepID=A0A4R3MF23_9FIRM|nr:GNAT family N-acetyltransferase [Natranaerovirga pectinivora]TCT12106.1 phosphinothricin acetyltransferase [Natranaerovirga pectinivora]
MIIRDGKLKDLGRITEIYNQAILKTVATFDIEPKTVQDRKNWFDKYFSDNLPIFVMEVDNVVCGWISLSKLFDKCAYKNTTEISLYVDENFRCQGIGNQLMAHLLKEMRENRKCHTIIARIASENHESIKLHLKHGFKLAGELKEVGYKFDRYIDVQFYQWINDNNK